MMYIPTLPQPDKSKTLKLPRGIGPMLPMHEYHYVDGKEQLKFPQIIEPKMDGIRCFAHITHEDVQLFSRHGHIKFPEIREELQQARKDNVYFVDGELVTENMDVNELLSLKNTRNHIRRVAKKLNEIKLYLYVFDMVTEEEFKNPDRMLPLSLRKRRLVDWVGYHNFNNIRLVPFQDVFTNDNIEKIYQDFRKSGFEGCVLKDPQSLYYPKKRRIDWRKRKDQETVDLVVRGIYPGKNGYQGMVGGLYIEGFCPHKQRYIESKVSSGIKLAQRKEWQENPSSIIGKVVEIQYQDVSKKGRLRHPAFLKIREDREPKDILINKLVRRFQKLPPLTYL